MNLDDFALLNKGPLTIKVAYRQDHASKTYGASVYFFDRSAGLQEFFRINPYSGRPHYHHNFEGENSDTVLCPNIRPSILTKYLLDLNPHPWNDALRSRRAVDTFLSSHPHFIPELNDWVYETSNFLLWVP